MTKTADWSNFVFRQINETQTILPFDCGDVDLNDFLFVDAINYFKSMMALTFLLEDPTAYLTVAYYSLLNDKLIFEPDNKKIWNRLNRKIANNKRRKEYPAVKIGRLAVSKEYAHHHIGEEMILMIKHIFSTLNRSACRFITVDAYASATSFYENCGFLYLSMKDINQPTRAMYFDLLDFKG